MENGFVSARRDVFPAGLRVLVVDDDPTWIRILEKMLKKCCYEVTKCCVATEALDLLRQRKDGFDIVISDVNMPDMDGFKLLEQVGLEMNLPVIMMSVDGEISRVMKGVLHGACDYLLKPIRMKELQNIWQHVLRKKIGRVKDGETHDGYEGFPGMRSGFEALDDGNLLAGGDLASPSKRKNAENFELDEQDFSDGPAAKRARIVWTVELHQKFVNAVNQIGLDKVGPRKIRDLMDIPWLTRENVASHLQKYRLFLSRLQKQKPSFDETQTDFFSMDASSSFGLQSSTSMHRNDKSHYGFTSLTQNVTPDIHEVNSKAHILRLPVAKSPKPVTADVPYIQKSDSDPTMGLASSFESRPGIEYTLFEPTPLVQHPWCGDTPMMLFAQQPEHKPSIYQPSPTHHIQEDLLGSVVSSIDHHWSVIETAEVVPPEITSLSTFYGNYHVDSVSPTPNTVIPLGFDGIIPPYIEDQSFNQHSKSNWGTQQQNHIVQDRTTLVSSQRDKHLSSIQRGYNENAGGADYHVPELNPELSNHLHDRLRFNSDFLFDPVEYPSIGEGLFIN